MSVFDPKEPRNQYQWNRHDLEVWFEYVAGKGWLVHFGGAVSRYPSERESCLLAQSSKEGGLSFWLRFPEGDIPGDRSPAADEQYQAFGLFQLHMYGDQRWQDYIYPEQNVPEAARRLSLTRTAMRKFLSGNSAPWSSVLEDSLVLDSFNIGLHGEEGSYVRDPPDPDAMTAHHNYSADVLAREAVMTILLGGNH